MVGWFLFQLVTMILQIRFDGFTWQMSLIYALPLFWLLYYRTIFKKLQAVIMVMLFIFTSLILVVFSTPDLEAPDGKYVVGTTTIYLIDETREREIPLHVYYPSESSEGKSPENWFENESVTEGFAEYFGVPPFILEQLNDVKTNSYKNIEMIDGPLPTVVLSHGWSSFGKLHINIIEMLASHGYIVVVPDHTEISSISMLHTGEIVKGNKDLLTGDELMDDGSRIIDLYSDDIVFIMDRLSYLNDHHKILYHSIDFDRFGFIGHSTGSGAQIKYALDHPVTALIGMDSWVEPIEGIKSLDMPSLFIRSSQWEGYNNDGQLRILTDKVLQPTRSRHPDFTIAYKFSPAMPIVGYSSGKNRQAIEQTILAYFDKYLMDKETMVEKKLPIKELR